jgi:Trypsin
MRSIAIACVYAVATVVVAIAPTSVSYASQRSLSLAQASPAAAFGPMPTALPVESSPLAKEMAVLTDRGITSARASQALSLQDKVSEADLIGKVGAALAGSYAGMWFEPAAAKFHVGVTSSASRRVAERLAAQAGLAADVVETPVRSTWAALIAVQSQWNKRLAKPVAEGEATTGIDPSRNAVTIKLSSSIPSAERVALTSGAGTAGVNVLIKGLPSQSHVEKDAKKNCISPFILNNAYCEENIVAGVRILTLGESQPPCTAGPMLIEGTETYMLTAGHCFGLRGPKTGTPITGEVTSQYTEGPQLEIGKEGTWYENIERDVAEVKVNREAHNFTSPMPIPVLALTAEWEEEPKKPHVVGDVEAVAGEQVVCHEGQTTGEKCGEVKALNVYAAGTEHLAEAGACAEGGDSGGPYFMRVLATGEILMIGMHVASTQCLLPFEAYFEPLLDLELAPTFGILSIFKPQKLLTTANELRAEETTLSAEWLANGSAIATALASETSTEFLLEDNKTLTGKSAVLCNGILDGTVSPSGEALVEKLLNLAKEEIVLLGLALLGTGAGSDCVAVSGCAEGTATSPIEVWAEKLSWPALLLKMENGAIAELFEGEGFEVLCLVLSLNVEDLCEASDFEFTVLNDPTTGDAEIPARQAGLPLATCTLGGAETGVIETDAIASITLTSGELLTAS